jgi:hypothetical protein
MQSSTNRALVRYIPTLKGSIPTLKGSIPTFKGGIPTLKGGIPTLSMIIPTTSAYIPTLLTIIPTFPLFVTFDSTYCNCKLSPSRLKIMTVLVKVLWRMTSNVTFDKVQS